MFKKRMTAVIIGIALVGALALLFPACNKNKSGKDYSGLLKGDFSVVAGTYVTNNGSYRVELKANGEIRGRGWISTVASYGAIYEGWSKTYNWQENPPPGAEASPIPWVLWPVGVDVLVDGKVVKTDTSKERITIAGFDPPTAEQLLDDLYYRETSGTTVSVEEPRDYDGPEGPQDTVSTETLYFYATTNLRLRSEPDTSKDNRIAGVPQGSRVELIELGNSETIDNINARWFKVKTDVGTTGWLFSGYLTLTEPSGSYDYAKILNKDFSDFAGNWKNGNGDREQLKKDGIFGVNGREIFPPKRESNGAYSWIVGSGQDGWYMKLYPVGTAVPGVQSDTTKVRLTMILTPDGTASQAEIYYKD